MTGLCADTTVILESRRRIVVTSRETMADIVLDLYQLFHHRMVATITQMSEK